MSEEEDRERDRELYVLGRMRESDNAVNRKYMDKVAKAKEKLEEDLTILTEVNDRLFTLLIKTALNSGLPSDYVKGEVHKHLIENVYDRD